MDASRRRLLATLAGGVGSLAGCQAPGLLGSERAGGSASGSDWGIFPDWVLATPAPPAYARCEGEDVDVSIDHVPDPPSEYNRATVQDYVNGIERQYKPDTVAEGAELVYFDFKTVQLSVRPVDWGFLVEFDASIGWGTTVPDEADVDVLHADDSYVASYFVNRTVVRRAEAHESVDPRDTEVGRLLICRA